MGLARETTFGTAVSPVTAAPATGITLNPDPGLFYPKTMMGVKDLQIFPLYGQLKFNGALDFPMFPTNGMLAIAAALGLDGAQSAASLSNGQTGNGVSGAGSTQASVNASVAASTTSLPLTASVSFAGSPFALYEQNEVVQLTAGSGTSTLTVTRAAVGTTATTHSAQGSASVGNGVGATFANPLPGLLNILAGATTVAASIAAGATSVTLVAITGFASAGYIQIDVNNGSVSTSEVRHYTLAGSVATFDQPLTFTHAAGTCALAVQAPFTHIIMPQNVIPSLTLERNTGGFESLQFYGCRVNKATFKTQSTNSEAGVSLDVIAKGASVLATPSAVASLVVNESPWIFAEAGVSFFGTPVASMNNVSSVELSIENGVKDTFTFSQSHTLTFLSSLTRKVSGTMTVVWNSFDDATYGYYNKMISQSQLVTPSTQLNFQWQHPTYSQGRIELVLPSVNIAKYTDDVKMEDVVMTNLGWEASYNLSGAAATMAMYVNSPSNYLGY